MVTPRSSRDGRTPAGKGTRVASKYHVGNVTRPVLSVSNAVKQGKAVWFSKKHGGGVIPEEFFDLQLHGEINLDTGPKATRIN